jgi:hypothetical protein
VRLTRGLLPGQVYFACALALVVIIVLGYQVPPNDFWWHLAWGRSIAAHGPWFVPSESGFTHPASPFFDQPWLAQLIMYGLFVEGGPDLMLAVQAILLGATYGLLVDLMVRRAGGLVRPSVLLFIALVIPLSANNWALRPQSYAYVLFVLVLRFVTFYRLRWPVAAWPLVPIFVLWANLHGSFILGLGLLGIAVAVEGVRCARRVPGDGSATTLTKAEWKRLFGWSSVAAAATCLNPHGPRVYAYALGVPALLAKWDVCVEWKSPSPKTLWGAVFAAGLIVVLILLARAKKRIDATDLVTLVLLLWSALTATRSIVWFALVAAPVAAEALASLSPQSPVAEEEPSLAGLVVVGALGVLALAMLPMRHRGTTSLDYAATPVLAVEYLQKLAPSKRPRRLFQDEGTGSYLLYAAPEQPVFIDPRYELYPEQQWRDLQRLNAGADAERLLAKYQVDGLLLRTATQEGLIARVSEDATWAQSYRDDDAVVYLRAATP